jgi:hypothetical protein
MVITEEINGMGSHKSKTQSPKTAQWVRQKQESRNSIRKELSALAEIKTDDRKAQDMKRKSSLKKYNIQKKENLAQVSDALKQKVAARCNNCLDTGRPNHYYQNKIFRTDCKKFYNLLRQTNSNVKNAPNKDETGNCSSLPTTSTYARK